MRGENSGREKGCRGEKRKRRERGREEEPSVRRLTLEYRLLVGEGERTDEGPQSGQENGRGPGEGVRRQTAHTL